MKKDKLSIIQVLGSILQNPSLIIDENYPLTDKDFPERFHKIVFGAMDNLIRNGIQKLTEISIDDFLSKYPKQHKVFTDNDGLDYLANAKQIADVENFEYYYKTLKKFSLLNQLEEKGFDTSSIYDEDIINLSDNSKMQEKFDSYTVDDIFDLYEKSLIQLKHEYSNASQSTGCQAAKGMREQKERYKQLPEMGMPMASRKMTTICRGRKLKKLYLKTAPSGFGKTRISVGDACCISIPEIYDTDTKQWVKTNCNEPTLFISTELEPDEVQSMIMAYVSAVPEDKILDGKYKDDEEERVDKAIDIIAESNLYIEHIPNFDIDDIENTIKKYKVEQKIGYVFFDYVFTSIKIMSEVAQKTKGVKMREDNVLIMFVDRMKTLANLLNVHIDTSSQANGDWKNAKDGDQNLIRGAKGMADKVDVGYAVLPPSPKDLENIKALMKNGFNKVPNLVFHIYKVRRGKINRVKLWLYFDYGTCRTKDLFVTDNDYKLLDIESTDIEVVLENTQEKKEEIEW